MGKTIFTQYNVFMNIFLILSHGGARMLSTAVRYV